MSKNVYNNIPCQCNFPIPCNIITSKHHYNNTNQSFRFAIIPNIHHAIIIYCLFSIGKFPFLPQTIDIREIWSNFISKMNCNHFDSHISILPYMSWEYPSFTFILTHYEYTYLQQLHIINCNDIQNISNMTYKTYKNNFLDNKYNDSNVDICTDMNVGSLDNDITTTTTINTTNKIILKTPKPIPNIFIILG